MPIWQNDCAATLRATYGSAAARISPTLSLSIRLSRMPFKNLPLDMGPSAVLRHKNVYVVLTSRTGPHFAPQLFEAAGLAPFSAGVLVAKSPCGFRAAYQEKAHKIIAVRTTGCAPADFWRYSYQNIPQPLWPWHDIDS